MSDPRLCAAALILAAWPALAQGGDAEAGERAFRACQACHMVGEGAAHRVGPHLNGVMGRAAGGAEGFGYSDAMIAAGLVWEDKTLDAYIADPKGVVPGTRMAYRGLADASERADLIAYLATFSDANTAEGTAPEATTILALDGDAAYGAYLASECSGCHAAGGAGIPRIEGMARASFVAALVQYRDGTRAHQVMEMLAGRLSDDEIAALAAHFTEN